MIDVLVGISSTDAEVADAGYRLSWNFPAVAKRQQRMLTSALQDMSDWQLTKVLRGAEWLFSRNLEYAAESIADLVAYVPGINKKRIERLLNEKLLPKRAVEAAIQLLEYVSDEAAMRDDLRAKYGR